MTLMEISTEYRSELDPLRQRIRRLREELQTCQPQQRPMIDYRLKRLSAIYRQTRELSDLLEHYYERGFYRNGKYTL